MLHGLFGGCSFPKRIKIKFNSLKKKRNGVVAELGGGGDGPGVCYLIKKPSYHVLHPVLDWAPGLRVAWWESVCVGELPCVFVSGGGVFACRCASHHVLVSASDFVCFPGLPVIAVGHFVWLHVLGAAKTLGSLGDQAGNPHSPLEVDLQKMKKKKSYIRRVLEVTTFLCVCRGIRHEFACLCLSCQSSILFRTN